MATNDDDAAASSAKDDNEVFYVRTYVRLIPLRARDLQKRPNIFKEEDIAPCSLRSNHTTFRQMRAFPP